jgi:hypothetical protein
MVVKTLFSGSMFAVFYKRYALRVLSVAFICVPVNCPLAIIAKILLQAIYIERSALLLTNLLYVLYIINFKKTIS